MPSSRDADNVAYVRQQYKTDENLSVRIRTHELYGEPRVNFAEWVLDHVEWRGDEIAIDVGCGSGIYINPVRHRTPGYVAGDLSLGMLAGLTHPGMPRVNLDAQQLPFATASADVILANHMLYHVPDQEAAVYEFARVLRPGGFLLAATNSDHTMAELYDLRHELGAYLGWTKKPEIRPSLSFTLENGAALLGSYFAHVVRHDLAGALVFPEPQPVIDYLASTRARYEELLPAGVSWDRHVVPALNQILQHKIASHGEFRVNKLTGLFVCRSSP